ncbi:hypothetical protein CPB84DRAFT_1766812 [Gymnopilus junonius]|uniref:Zn(2)-C6 fungal-type domain-containing protein n=1 Tax=Gymnopilus junonius TaxID=109634 RepID=A0A9P5TSB1_GYMJU|nr:hypothetical protein CPB84DRAFT_1766812 [Gymnopilus junonius]
MGYENSKAATELDHRKRPRNRTTQSCLSCHAAKRMCDRKRPACSRCIQLGQTGYCAYEVDDPFQSMSADDETSRLLKRVAELEEVVRELKNKPRPHPRWLRDSSFAPANIGEGTDPLENQRAPPLSTNTSSSPGSSPISELGRLCDSSQADTFPSDFLNLPPSPISLSPADNYGSPQDYDLTFFMQNPVNTDVAYKQLSGGGPSLGHCGCMFDPATYQAMLELSLRLRKASDVLGHSPTHRFGEGFCHLHQRILELDLLSMNTLGSPIFFNSHTMSQEINQGPSSGHPRFWDLPPNLPYSGDGLDTFMSWKPHRH